MGNITSIFDVADSREFYNGNTYETLENAMNDPAVTNELNNKVTNYIYENLAGQMYGNPEGQGYNNYTIPEKFKNGSYTLDELFTSASQEFGVPKDILVAASQHECGQDYMPINSYTGEREQNCGGMMGILDVNNIQAGFLPQGGLDGVDTLNPALSVYSYAASLRFNYDYFKDLDLGYGLDGWDVAVGINAVGIGNFRNPEMGFTKQSSDYITNLNTVLPEYKALRTAYAEGRLGVNDLTLDVANGGVVDWSDGQEMIYNYESGTPEAFSEVVEKELEVPQYNSAISEEIESIEEVENVEDVESVTEVENVAETDVKSKATTTLSANIDGEETEVLEEISISETKDNIDNMVENDFDVNANTSTEKGFVWSNGTTAILNNNGAGVGLTETPLSTDNSNNVNEGIISNNSANTFNGISSNSTGNIFGGISSNSAGMQSYGNVATAVGIGVGVGNSFASGSFIGVRTKDLEYFVTDICNKTIKETISRIKDYLSVFNTLENGWTGKSLENFESNYRKAVIEIEHTIYKAYYALVKEISDVANGMIEQDKKMVDII